MGKTIKLQNDTYLANDLYSGNEIVIGKWYDDKTLYRKVIDYITADGDSIVDLTSLNIDTMVDIRGIVGTAEDWKPINFYFAGYSISTRYANGYIYINSSSVYANLPFHLIIEYTKK